ncbi:MAG: RNA 2'-phosphotransferase [Candidatus Thermoplasmatota archaeon]
MNKKTEVSKYISYLLRHNPKDLDISKNGFASINQVLNKVRKKFPEVDREILEKITQNGNKRFQIKNNKIRALYGHSIPVDIELEEIQDEDVLYHGTTPKAAREICRDGLKTKGRQRVHLSSSIDEALRVGKRRCPNPVVLEINVKKAQREGVCFSRATNKVVVSDEIPSSCISKKDEN